jgi:hypothetical protein
MRRFLAAVLFLVACGSAVPISEPPTVEDAAEGSQFALIDNMRAYCGAVSISPRMAVTAEHCIQDGPLLEYAIPDGNWYEFGTARLVAVDTVADVALLYLDNARPVWLPLQLLSPPQTGDRVRDRNGWTTVRDADYWTSHDGGPMTAALQTESIAFKGMSGSALIDRYGRLIGTCRGFERGTGHGIFAPVSAIATLWSEAEKP